MKNIDVSLYGEQSTIFSDWCNTDKNCIDILPAGSGKTYMASLFLPIAAGNPFYHRGKDVIYSAPTQNMIKALVWEPLKNNCRNYFGIEESAINNSELTIRFPNGVFIRCKSAEQRENLRGLNAGIWVADEAALYTEDSLQEMFNRLRPRVGSPDTTGRMIIISTPYGAGPLYDIFKTALDNPDRYIVRHYNYLQMRASSREFIEEQKKLLSPLKFEQDYMCSFESVADQFYYAWRRTMAVEEPIRDRNRELWTFHDFNKRVMCAVVAQVVGDIRSQTGRIEVLKSYAIPDCSTEQLAQAIRYDFPTRTIQSIMDMSGAQVNRDTTSQFGVTDRTILEKYGFRIFNTKNSNPLVSDSDNSSNAFINQGRLTIWAGETKLLDALETYHYEDGSRKKLVKYSDAKYAHIDGLGDCIRYGIHHLFPMTHDHIGGAEYIDGMERYDLEPGFEYLTETNTPKTRDGVPTIDHLLKTRFEQQFDDEAWG